MPTNQPAPITAHSTQAHRFHLLDALRGILAVLVVFRHAPSFLTSAVQTKDIFLAVDFFFCLSGFVIAYAYDDRLRTKLRLRDFVVARVIRFYPTFLVGTLLAFAVTLGPDHFLSHPHGGTIVLAALPSLLFLPSLPLASTILLFPLNMSSWTLFLELVVNLAYAVLIRSKVAVKSVLIFVCTASWLVLALTPRALDSGSTWPGFVVGSARMGLSFTLGVFLLNYWKKLPRQGVLRRTRGLPTATLIVVILLAVILVPTPFSGQRAYQLFVMTVVLPALIFFGADIKLGRWGAIACAVLGDLSYPLYIVHYPLLAPLYGSHVTHLAERHHTLIALLVPVYIVSLAALAWALRAYFDAPLGRWLTRRYNGRTRSESKARALGTQPQLAQG